MLDTLSLLRTPLCSSAHTQEVAVVLMAPATLPAFHTQLGMMISLTTITANSPNLWQESRVDPALITRRDSREKNFSRSSGSLSVSRFVTNIGITSSRISPTTGPWNTQKYNYCIFNCLNISYFHPVKLLHLLCLYLSCVSLLGISGRCNMRKFIGFSAIYSSAYHIQ